MNAKFHYITELFDEMSKEEREELIQHITNPNARVSNDKLVSEFNSILMISRNKTNHGQFADYILCLYNTIPRILRPKFFNLRIARAYEQWYFDQNGSFENFNKKSLRYHAKAAIKMFEDGFIKC